MKEHTIRTIRSLLESSATKNRQLLESDSRTRGLEQRYIASGDADDLHAWLLNRIRSGEDEIEVTGPRAKTVIKVEQREEIKANKKAMAQGKLDLQKVKEPGIRVQFWFLDDRGNHRESGGRVPPSLAGRPAKLKSLRMVAETHVLYNGPPL